MNTTTNKKLDILAKQYRVAYKTWERTNMSFTNIADVARARIAYREMVKARQALMDASK